jgi:tetratricopeptide (TPR) repeat protein
VLSRLGGSQHQRSALLGTFAAGTGAAFSIDAAAACWQMTSAEARQTLDVMVESALLQHMPGALYSLHRSLRDHLRRAANPNHLVDAAGRVRDYYLNLVEGGGDSSQIDAQLSQIMNVFKQTNDQSPELSSQFADALLGFFEQRGLWANLVTLSEAVVDSAHRLGDLAREHSYLNDLGYAHTILGNLDKAKDCFDRSLMVSEAMGDPTGEASALNNIGAVYERKGQYVEAEQFYQRSLAIRQQVGSPEEVVDALANIAGAMYWQNRWDEALSTFHRVLDMHNVLGSRPGQARTFLNIGAVYENMNSDHEALQAYQQSLAIYSNLGDESGQSQALNNLGIVYLNDGDTERALAHFKRSLSLKERLGDRQGQASTLNNIALLYEKTGSPSLALEHYEQSYKLLTALDDSRADLVQENIDKLQKQMERRK